MKHLLFIALLAATPVEAGTISFSITTTATGTVTKSYTQFNDADMVTWIAAYQNQCNGSINAVCTSAQVLSYIIQQYITSQENVITNYNRNQQAATVPPTSIKP